MRLLEIRLMYKYIVHNAKKASEGLVFAVNFDQLGLVNLNPNVLYIPRASL